MATPTEGAARITGLGSAVDRLTGAFQRSAPPVRAGAPARLLPPVAPTSPQAVEAFDPPDGWFPSGRPLSPVAPPGTTTGRRWDYPSFINFNYTPRGEQGVPIGFETLRRMAEPAEGGLDLLRLAIETRKDQMAAQRWKIRGVEKNDNGGQAARDVEAWLSKPDGVHTFRQWMRSIVEDHLVIDAPAVYLRTAQIDGEVRPLFEPMDGATLKLLILAEDGRTPMPPLPAYQQVLKGMPTQDYTLDEIGYYPYNVRTNRLYGMSHVEQVLATIAISLNRQMSQLAYFTAGTIPDGFMEVPKEWSQAAIKQFTEWFNSEMSGQLGERRKMRFVPADAKYVATKDQILKDTFDEWLIRIICYCFSLPPQAFVKEMNRATSETSKEAAQEEGLEPMKLWFSDLMDDLLRRAGFPNLRWQWADEEIVDPEAKARVAQSYYGGTTGTAKAIMTLAEVREFASLPPATPDQLKELQPPAPEPIAAGGATPPRPGGTPPGKPGDKAPSSNGANGNGKKPGTGDEGTTTKVGGARAMRLRPFGYRAPWNS
jgi:hypothetical protein